MGKSLFDRLITPSHDLALRKLFEALILRAALISTYSCHCQGMLIHTEVLKWELHKKYVYVQPMERHTICFKTFITYYLLLAVTIEMRITADKY